MKLKTNSITMLALLSMGLILMGACVGPAKTNSAIPTSASIQWTTYPGFEEARKVAPSLMQSLLNENTNLRAEVKELKASK